MTKDEKIIVEAQERFHRAEDRESPCRALFIEDLKFAEADSDNGWQWPSAISKGREESHRPCLTLNKTRQHCLHIINDARQNKAGIKISPTGDGATDEAATILEGICRHIEYQSNATEAYEAAVNTQVRGGWGYWRVLTDYADDGSVDLEIYIRRIANPLTVYLDPDIEQFDGSDAMWGIIFRDRPRDQAENEHPKLKDGWETSSLGNSGWIAEDSIREAEYYRIVETKSTLSLLDDGSKHNSDDGDVPEGRTVLRNRPVTKRSLEWFKIVGDKIVDREVQDGRYVPIVRVIGEETNIEGKLDRKGHTRFLKDAQRMENYWFSAAVEHIALQTKAPYIAAAEAIEGHETYWEKSNVENRAILAYNHRSETGQELPAPRREQPPVMAPAYMEGMKLTDLLMMQVSGQYQAELGRPGNETSGVAIGARQRQGDNATYHYVDHLAQAIRLTGRILIDLIPHVYDTPRILKIMSMDGTESEVHIDPALPTAHAVMQADPAPSQQLDSQGQQASAADAAAAQVKTLINPSIGKYQVEADVGPSFGTQRQEAFNAFTQIVSQNASLMPIIGDIMFKNADFPGADDLAERLKRMVPQQALGGPPPAMLQLQQQLQAVQQHGQALTGRADQEIAALKQQLSEANVALGEKQKRADIEDYRAETDRLEAVAKGDPEAFKVLIRSMLSEMLQMPATPVIQAHAASDAAHQQILQGMTAPPGMTAAPGSLPPGMGQLPGAAQPMQQMPPDPAVSGATSQGADQ